MLNSVQLTYLDVEITIGNNRDSACVLSSMMDFHLNSPIVNFWKLQLRISKVILWNEKKIPQAPYSDLYELVQVL